MERLEGWESTKSFGDFKVLKAGVYKCKINKIDMLLTASNKKFIKIELDIADGEFKNYFKEKFENDTRIDKKWSGIWNLFIQGYEPNSINSKFKGLIESVIKSNAGFLWNWNEQELVNKYVGIVFREEEFQTNDGSIKSSAKPYYAIPVNEIANVKIPEPKLLTVEVVKNDNTDFFQDGLPF